ncbi:hypothetical protein BDV30DRAFT_202697, partial [Aspergillus minisclerotigenes]
LDSSSDWVLILLVAGVVYGCCQSRRRDLPQRPLVNYIPSLALRQASHICLAAHYRHEECSCSQQQGAWFVPG